MVLVPYCEGVAVGTASTYGCLLNQYNIHQRIEPDIAPYICLVRVLLLS